MCVIFLADKARPSEEMLQLGFDKNPHGIGLAWREESEVEGKKKTVVRWTKGINLEEAKKLCAELPLPYCIHFRAPSADTSKEVECCHPFPVDSSVSLYLDGRIPGSVVFHNGYWPKWKDNLLEAAVRSGRPLPPGAWSDSRGLAWMAANFGSGVLELINEKVIEFAVDFIEVYGNGWERVNEVLCSNKQWERAAGGSYHQQAHFSMAGRGRHTQNYPATSAANTSGGTDNGKGKQSASTGGSTQENPFRHTGASERGEGGGQAQQQEIQEGGETVGQGDREAAEWARGLNPKAIHGGSLAPIVVQGRAYHVCNTCFMERGLLEDKNRQPMCWNCWEKNHALRSDASENYQRDLCGTCNTQRAVSIATSTGKWICGVCWEKAGKPAVQRIFKSGDPALDKRRLDAARGISHVPNT